jgi:hypothetical protein
MMLNISMLSYTLQAGTPTSGKSMLAVYLAHNIYQQEPAANITLIPFWDPGGGDWQSYLRTKYDWAPGKRTFLIFDEAQTSYEDTALWIQYFKALPGHNKQFAVAFASYGSPTSRLYFKGAQIAVSDDQRVTLRHTDHDGIGIVGLLFTETEFNELVEKIYPTGHQFDPLFTKGIFELSGGHVGAIHDLLGAISKHGVRFFMMFDRII